MGRGWAAAAAGIAVTCVAPAAAQQQRPADALVEKALAIDALVQPDASLAAWNAAIAALEAETPRRPLVLARARNLRANAHINLGDTRTAAAEVAAAMALTDDSREGKIRRGEIHSNLGTLADMRSDWPGAKAEYERALALRREVFGKDSPEAAQSAADLGLVMTKMAEIAAAVPILEHAWDVLDRARPADDQARLIAGVYLANGWFQAGDIDRSERLLRRLVSDGRALGPAHPLLAQVNSQLAGNLSRQGRMADALEVHRASLVALKANGANPTVLADVQMDSAVASLSLDHPAASAAFATDAAANFASIGQNLSSAAARTQQANAERRLGRAAAAVATAEEAVRMAEANTPEIPLATALFRSTLADSYALAGRLPEALKVKQAAHDGIAKVRPTTHPQRTNVEMGLGWIMALNGDPAGGLAQYRPAFERVVASSHRLEVGQARAGVSVANIDAYGQGLQTAWLAKDAGFGFRVAQVMVESDAGRATLATLARLAARDAATAERLDRRRTLLGKRLDLDGQRVAKALTDAAAADAIGRDIAAIDAELAPIEAALKRDFPDFDTLLRPDPETLAAVQARLAPGEVLIVPVTSYQGLYTFAIARGRVAFGHAPMLRSEARDRIARVRASIMPRGALRAGEDASGDVVAPPAFARDDAAALHAAVFTPEIAAVARDAKLLSIAPDDVMSTIPFSLLPTAAATDAPYLIERVALRVVPAIAALGRSATAAKGGGFVGIGAPERPAATGDATLAKALERLPPLPGAAEELRAMEEALRGGTVVTGAAATEARLAAPDVAQARVLAFATHGLVSGDFDALTEPALLLSPDPAAKGSAADGLLTASEAAALSLQADWVVLSACNTAAGDTVAAPGYAGLARAFLFAGGRQVLASHWPVRDDISARLTVGTIRAQAAGRSGPEALRGAMIALLRDRNLPGAANPALWAPFMVVSR